MTTERNKQIARASIERARAMCVAPKKRRAISTIEANDEYFEKCGWWLATMISRASRKENLTVLSMKPKSLH